MNADTLLREFFCDAIGRAIPGLFLILFYQPNILNEASPGITTCVFVAAWFLGTIIEQLTYYPVIKCISKLKTCYPDRQSLQYLENYLHPDLSEAEKTSGRTNREIAKVVAEGTMFRCLSVICALNFICNPDHFSTINWNRLYNACALAIFLFAYHFLKRGQQGLAQRRNQDQSNIAPA